MSEGDGMDSSTRVPTARHAWVPVATSYHARHSTSPHPKALVPVEPTRRGKPQDEATGCLGPSRAGERGGKG
jgi:hypothetical protein